MRNFVIKEIELLFVVFFMVLCLDVIAKSMPSIPFSATKTLPSLLFDLISFFFYIRKLLLIFTFLQH